LVQQQFQNTQASRPQTELIKGCLGRGLRCQTVRVHPALSIIVDCGVEERAGTFYRADDGEKKNLFFAQKPNIKMNKHVNKVRKATGRAEAITAGWPSARGINCGKRVKMEKIIGGMGMGKIHFTVSLSSVYGNML